MSRYRPPAPAKSPYITSAGAKVLREELKQLWEQERPPLTRIVHEAAKNGDRSENGDYIYGKQRLREIDRRIHYLSKRLEQISIVNEAPQAKHKVFFAAFVDLEDEAGMPLNIRIVGCDEIDPSKNYISIDSPIAKALLGKALDEEIYVYTPQGKKHYWITAIRYEN